jgi:hypothetical protein
MVFCISAGGDRVKHVPRESQGRTSSSSSTITGLLEQQEINAAAHLGATFSSFPREGHLEGVYKVRVALVFGLFWPLFRSKLGGPYTAVDIAPQVLNRKSAQKNRKIDRTSLCRYPLKPGNAHENQKSQAADEENGFIAPKRKKGRIRKNGNRKIDGARFF